MAMSAIGPVFLTGTLFASCLILVHARFPVRRYQNMFLIHCVLSFGAASAMIAAMVAMRPVSAKGPF